MRKKYEKKKNMFKGKAIFHELKIVPKEEGIKEKDVF